MLNDRDFYRSLCTEPPADIMERNLTSIHLFTEVLRQMADANSEVSKSNKINELYAGIFIEHPHIHGGYYDNKRNGVLYVTDWDTGELIRKDESFLLPNGRFVNKKSAKLKRTDTDQFRFEVANMKSNNPDPQIVDKWKESFIFDTQLRKYIPFNVNDFYYFLRMRDFVPEINRYFSTFCDVEGIATDMDADLEAVNAAMPRFAAQLVESFPRIITRLGFLERHSTNWVRQTDLGFKVPDRSTIMNGTVLHDGDTFGRQVSLTIRNHSFPVIYLNSPVYFGAWDGRLRDNHVLINLMFRDFPFNFAIRVNQQTMVNRNKNTPNNEGQELQHNAKVTDFKVPFKMTEEEARHYDILAKQHKEVVKAWRLRVSEREKQIRKDMPGHSASDYRELLRREGWKEPLPPKTELPIFLGVEIELIPKAQYLSNAGKAKIIKTMADAPVFGDHHISKRDGSLGTDLGLEIVTIPATLRYHKDVFENHFFAKDLHKTMMSSERCGIHVHISKNSFTTMDLGKFMAFINSETNRFFIDAMSGREPNVYCVRPKNLGLNAKGVDVSAKMVKQACAGGNIKQGLSYRRLEPPHGDTNLFRRVSVNIQNPHTVEVRIFKSASNKNNILRKIEFCDALVRFVREHSMQQMTAWDFVNFILDKSRRKDYPCILRWMASKDYIDHERKKIEGKNKIVHIYSNNKLQRPNSLFHSSKQLQLNCPKPSSNSTHKKGKK